MVNTASVFLSIILASITAALGFKMASSNEFNSSINKMGEDFIKDATMAKFIVTVGPGALLYKVTMFVKDGITYAPQELVSWVQSWWAKNGAYATSSATIVPPPESSYINGSANVIPLSVLYSTYYTSLTSKVQDNILAMINYVNSKYGDSAVGLITFTYSDGNVFEANCDCTIIDNKSAIDKQYIKVNYPNTTGSFITVSIAFLNAMYVQFTDGKLHREELNWTGSSQFSLSKPFFSVGPIGSYLWSGGPNTGTYTIGNTTGSSPTTGKSLPTSDDVFPKDKDVKTGVDVLNDWITKQFVYNVGKVVDKIIDGAQTVAGEVESTLGIPVSIPVAETENPSAVAEQSQADAQSGTTSSDIVKKLVNDAAKEEGGGESNPAILPYGDTAVSTTELYSLWNPSASELTQLATFMWSTDFVDVIKKVVQNPMDVIIGLTMVPVVPPQGADSVLKLGLVSTNITMTRISTQFTTFDCGSIQIPRAWNSYLDYEPYTICHLFLPFIGVVPLKTNEVMNATLSLKYNIDLLSGACTAMLYVTRNETSICMYTYGGNLSAPVPITSADFSRLYAGVLNATASIGTMIATGGASAFESGMQIANSVNGMRTIVSHSGSVSGNAGLLGNFTPYVFFDKPIPDAPNSYSTLYGKRSNYFTKLSSMEGFTRIQEVHVEGFVATDAEKAEIETLLKNGVIL